MKAKYLIPIFIFVSSITWNSNNTHAQAFENSFYFAIESKNGGYNSATKQFWQLYSGGRKEYHSIQLTEEELNAIYDEFKKATFSSLPSTYKPKSNSVTIVTPSFEYILESNFGGDLKKIYYNDRETDAAMKKEAKPFLLLYIKVKEIIDSNIDVQKIRKSNVRWE